MSQVMQMVFIVQENSTGHVIPCRLVLAQPPHLSAVRETWTISTEATRHINSCQRDIISYISIFIFRVI